MSDDGQIPFDADVATFAAWLAENFTGMPRDRRNPADVENVFDMLQHRGNSSEEWLDVLGIKVDQLRQEGMTWHRATELALEEWSATDPTLPPVWRAPINRSIDNLVQQLKNRRSRNALLGVKQVTEAHFYVAFVYGEFEIAAQVHHAVKAKSRERIQDFVRKVRTK